jgi:NDP-sugar pyrophosphorylase family protein
VKAVILAGGKGTRLKPYTTAFPKPLMPIGDKPILEILIRQLKSHNFTEITLMVGHLSELIMAFFGDGRKFGVDIQYSREEQPLGTVGGLSLIRNELKETFLMINGDTLTTLDFSDLIEYHKRSSAIATVALKKRQISIDFGVVKVNRRTSDIRGYVEKPTLENLVSMGVNAIQPEVLQYIVPGEYLDFPHLIQNLLAANKTVKGYMFKGYWLDIGRPDDYEKANAEIEEIYSKLGIT